EIAKRVRLGEPQDDVVLLKLAEMWETSTASAGKGAGDKFSFFFGFYGLMLGLAVTELLNGFGKLVRAGEVRKLGWQTGLLAVFLLIVIIATWIDAWESLRGVSLDIAGLWAPVLIAILYYLASTIVFPEHPAQWP